MRLLGLSGSLRRGSINTAVIEAAGALLPAGVELMRFEGLAALPAFNPDSEAGALPMPVQALRDQVAACDGLLVCSPEYARGIAGALKNALDWLVGDLAFPGIAAAVINAAPRAHHADAALKRTLATMSARLVPAACLTLPLPGRAADAAGILADPGLAEPLRAAVAALAEAMAARRRP